MDQNKVSEPLFGVCMVVVFIAVWREHGEGILAGIEFFIIRLLIIGAIGFVVFFVFILLWKFMRWTTKKFKTAWQWFYNADESIHQLINQLYDYDKVLNRNTSRLNSQREYLKDLASLVEELNEFTGLKEHKIAQEKIKNAVKEVTPMDFE